MFLIIWLQKIGQFCSKQLLESIKLQIKNNWSATTAVAYWSLTVHQCQTENSTPHFPPCPKKSHHRKGKDFNSRMVSILLLTHFYILPPLLSLSFLDTHFFFTTPTKMVLQMLLKPWLASEVKESLQASQEEQPVSAGVATRSINPLFPLSGWKVNLQYQNTRFILFLTCICLPLIYIVGSPNTRRAMYGNKDKHV